MWLIFFIKNTCSYSLRNYLIPICCISYICKIPKSWFNNQHLKKKRNAEKKERDLNWMENFKIGSSYLKLCYKFKAPIRCMKATFYRPDYQKFLMCSLNQRLRRAFLSTPRRAFETLGRAFETLGRAFEGLREN